MDGSAAAVFVAALTTLENVKMFQVGGRHVLRFPFKIEERFEQNCWSQRTRTETFWTPNVTVSPQRQVQDRRRRLLVLVGRASRTRRTWQTWHLSTLRPLTDLREEHLRKDFILFFKHMARAPLIWVYFGGLLTHNLPGLNHTATGGHHGVSDLLPSFAVLHRAAGKLKY